MTDATGDQEIKFLLETDNGSNDTYVNSYELYYIGDVKPLPDAPIPASVGAVSTGKYRNLFKELGYSDAEIDKKVESAWQKFFYGTDDERIYYPVGEDMAYIYTADTDDVRSEGMSYGMMICVQMDKQEEFNRLWKWAKTHMQHKSGEFKGYFAWQMNTNGTIKDNTPAADGLFQKGIIESGVYEAKVYQKEDGDGTAIVKALLKELNLDESEVEKLETIPYYELSNAYNKVEAEVAAKGCYIGQGPMENGWFHGNPIKCGFTDHAKTIPVLAGTNIGEFDFGPVVPGKHEMNREEQIAFLTRKYGDATPELISLFEKAYPDKTIADLWSVDTFFRPATIEFIRQKSEFTEAPTYSYQFTYEFPIDGGKAAWHCAEIPFVFHNIDRIAVCNVPGETDRLQERMATAWINFARYGSPETPSLPNWPACTPGDEATMIFDRTCEIRRNFDHELVKKLVETEYNPMTPVVEDEEEDAFFIH